MSEETHAERLERHRVHQEKMESQKFAKALRKERHYKHWHRIKVIPILMR
jgi:hypothetical protein